MTAAPPSHRRFRRFGQTRAWSSARAHDSQRKVLYCNNALPPYATKLLRIDAPVAGDIVANFEAWKTARCERWSVYHGWTPYPMGQMEIMATGDWDAIDPEKVDEVQANMLATYERFHAK